MTHELKTWPRPFRAVARGEKTHEVRKFDRPFGVGDTLLLREYHPTREEYTGRSALVRVTYISYPDSFGLPPDLCVMSICLESGVQA